MEKIDISQYITDFKQVFEKESRMIFSAKFGDGKSYFLNEFIESFVTIYFSILPAKKQILPLLPI